MLQANSCSQNILNLKFKCRPINLISLYHVKFDQIYKTNNRQHSKGFKLKTYFPNIGDSECHWVFGPKMKYRRSHF